MGTKSIGRKKRGSAWWYEEIKEMVREKRRLFEIYITDRNERNREEYRQKNQEVKRVTRQKKNEVDERDGIQLRLRSGFLEIVFVGECEVLVCL